MKTLVCPLLIHKAGRGNLRPFCQLHDSGRHGLAFSLRLHFRKQSRGDTGSQGGAGRDKATEQLWRGREASVIAGFRPGWRAGLSAERGCDKNDTGPEQGRGQMSVRNLLGFSKSFDCRGHGD